MSGMETHHVLLVLGGLLLCGLVADELGRRTRLPRVTLLIVFGVVVGPSGLDILPEAFHRWYEFLATIALTMVAFLLGGRLSVDALRDHGKEILTISVAVVATTVVVVGSGLLLAGVPFVLALLLAGIATATAPAATQDVVRQAGADGPFTDTLLGVVAIDDAWGLIIFSVLLVIANATTGDSSLTILTHGLWEVGGAVAIGLLVGLPAAYLTGRLKEGEPMQSEALGLVFVCAGLSVWFDVSFLLAGMVAGVTVANLAAHHKRPFHAVENIEWPFMVLFFVLAGASLDMGGVETIGLIGVAYIVLRFVSRIIGGWLGASLAGAPDVQRRWMGLALVPQAGVALGMALVAGEQLPAYKDILLTIVVGTTIVFELIGPVLTQIALIKAREGRQQP